MAGRSGLQIRQTPQNWKRHKLNFNNTNRPCATGPAKEPWHPQPIDSAHCIRGYKILYEELDRSSETDTQKSFYRSSFQ